MRVHYFLSSVFAVSILLSGCNGTSPVPEPTPTAPVLTPVPTPTPPGPKEPEYNGRPLMTSFTEDFSGQESPYLKTSLRAMGSDFRYFWNFPSFSENNTRIMMMRLDPDAGSGMAKGGRLHTEENYCFFGDYSARFRLPKTDAVQVNLGAIAELTAVNIGDTAGMTEITIQLRAGDPTAAYLKLRSGNAASPIELEKRVSLGSLNAMSKFAIYGFEWTDSHIVWYYKLSDAGSKVVLYEYGTSEDEIIPYVPAEYRFNYYHSNSIGTEKNANAIQAPYYMYELELDRMGYSRNDEMIENWYENKTTK